LLVLVVAAGLGLYAWHRCTEPDMTAVLAANNRAVGLLEQFKFQEAADAFEEVVRLAPRWVPGRINLGIALMTLAKGRDVPQEEAARVRGRAAAVFDEILKEDPRNPHAHFGRGLGFYNNAKWEDLERARDHFKTVTEIDDRDPAAWYWYGKLCDVVEDREQAAQCFRRALELNPYLNAARLGLQSYLMVKGDERAANELL